MKNIALATALIALLFSASAHAAVMAPVIAVVDQMDVLQKSDAVSGIEKQFEGRRKAFQEEVTKQEAALKASEEELKKKSASLAPDAFKKERDAFEQKVAAAQKKVGDMKSSLDADYGKALGVVQRTMLQVIADLAKDEGVNLVISNRQVILFAPELDITDKVAKKLNEKLPKVDVNDLAKPGKAPKE